MLPKQKRNKHLRENKRMSTLKKATFFSTHASVKRSLFFYSTRFFEGKKKEGK
jgi:hypothetical protein